MSARRTHPEAVSAKYRARFAALLHDPTFEMCATFRTQCKTAFSIINADLTKKNRVPLKEFAAFFHVKSVSSIHCQLMAADDGHAFHGRKQILTDDDLGQILVWINDSVENPRARLTLANIVERVLFEFGKLVSKDFCGSDWLRAARRR